MDGPRPKLHPCGLLKQPDEQKLPSVPRCKSSQGKKGTAGIVSMNPRIHNTAMEIHFSRSVFGAEMSPGMATRVAVGTAVTRRPPHRSVHAAFPHTAPISDNWRQIDPRDTDGAHWAKARTASTTARNPPIADSSAGCAASTRDAIVAPLAVETSASPACCPARRGSCNTPPAPFAANVLAPRSARASAAAARLQSLVASPPSASAPSCASP